MTTYEEAATRLGIPAEDMGGFIDFVSGFGCHSPGSIATNLMEDFADQLLDGRYHGSLLERRVLEARLSEGLPLMEAAAVASRLAANPSSAEGYGLLAHVLRAQVVHGPGEWLLREQLALVMGIPDEDRRAFDELLYNWMHGEAENGERTDDFDPDADPIPRAVLDEFWSDYRPSVDYLGSDLERALLRERALQARSFKGMQQVLFRMSAHVKANPDQPASEVREFFSDLSDALDHPNFEGKPPVQSLRAVA